ncbi:MAG: hypothetical protein U0457_03580 [Candidatus Sericytochromatia bacterium]
MYILKITNTKRYIDKKDIISKIFPKITENILNIIFSNDPVFITCTTRNAFHFIAEKFTYEAEIELEKLDAVPKENTILTSFVLPYPENNNIYDLIYIWGKSAPKELSIEIEAITELNKKDFIAESNACKTCYKETPEDINFCIFCGSDHNKNITEQREEYSIKINRISELSTRVKIAKYLYDNGENKDYKKILDSFNKFPINIELRAFNKNFTKFKELLNEYSIDFSYHNSNNVSKILTIFGNKIDIGNFEIKNDYFDPILSKNISETLKTSSSPILRKSLSKCLFEIYRTFDFMKTSESNAKVLLDQNKKDLEDILVKFLTFMRRANKLYTYFQEKSLEQINSEILFIKDKIEKSSETKAVDMYKQSLEIKEKEIEEYMKLNKSVEIIYSQIISVTTLLGSIRTKIAFIDTHDIQNEKGDFAEINKMKENIMSNLKAVEGVFYT